VTCQSTGTKGNHACPLSPSRVTFITSPEMLSAFYGMDGLSGTETGTGIFEQAGRGLQNMNDQRQSAPSGAVWKIGQVYVTAAICLALGVTLGYLFRGSASRADATPAPNAQSAASTSAPQMPTLEQMNQMALKKAEPLLNKLQSDPNNPELLAQVGRIYESAHQFKEAADYYGKSLAANPKNVTIRNEMASCLYYTGDSDGALKQLERSLKDDPKDANALFNLGMIRWQGKKDASGAVTAWEQLLKMNPNLEGEKKAQVQRLIADANQHSNLAEAVTSKSKE
jgi:cytochrome c-type biogenesis protein CcmH/NrfG